MFKKKFLGKFGLYFGALFFLFVGLLSTNCYASISTEFVDYAITTLNENGSWGGQNTAYHNALSHITDSQIIQITNDLNDKFNSLGVGAYTEKNIIVLTAYDSSNSITLYWTLSNVSAGDDSLGYLQLWRRNTHDTWGAYNGRVYYVIMNLSVSGSNTLISYGSSTYTIYDNSADFWPGSITFNELDNSYVANFNNIANGSPSNVVWITRPWSSGTLLSYAFIHDKSESGGYIPPTPPDPEPPQDTTGTITNPSGETTGAIDLSGIQNGITDVKNQISGDSQRIIDNQNQNTTQIVNAINSSNENYWGSGDDLKGDKQQEDIENNLNTIMSDLSGDLSQNETFKAIENAENGFLDLFRNKQEETAYDLAFEWDDFEYQGVVLIPAGSINISQMCRDNVQLGYIQGIIRVVFNFEVALTLIYQVWNLILATLGIDNPYLYENYNAVERMNFDTGETSTTGYKRYKIFKRKG